MSGAIRLLDEAEVEAQSRDEDASLLHQLTSTAPPAVPEAPEAWVRAHSFDVEIPDRDAWKAVMANVSQTKCLATDRFLELHRQDSDTMHQAVVKCVMHGDRAALLVCDQGSQDALEHVVGFLHSFRGRDA